MITHDLKADDYINKLKNNEFFSMTRWGDGEWTCASGISGPSNIDGHLYFEDLRRGLKRALLSGHDYYRAIWPTTHGQISVNLQRILNVIEESGADIEWYNAIVWEDLVLREGIHKLVDQLNKMNYIIVSSPDKKALNIDYVDFVEVPSVNCFLEKERIKLDIMEKVFSYKNPVFGFSASMATNVIVDELYPDIGDQCWMIDFGSIWEPFIGKRTRSYHDGYLTRTL